MTMNGTLLVFGHGYSARALTRLLLPQGWRIIGTTRSRDKAAELAREGVEPMIWPGDDPTPALAGVTHLLASIAPDADGDPVVRAHARAIAAAGHLRWVGYLSTTGVYGDHAGDWVDEDTPLTPTTERGQRRVLAERQWQELCASGGIPLHIFRLAGIYGPRRGPFEKLRRGTARRIVKPGQVFSRIHVEDIARALAASMTRPNAGGAVWNLCDDVPAPPQDVIEHAARLLGTPPPPDIDFESAELGEMARSFYSESKRVTNARIKHDLDFSLRYPDYRSGLAAVLAEETRAQSRGN